MGKRKMDLTFCKRDGGAEVATTLAQHEFKFSQPYHAKTLVDTKAV